MPKKAKTQAAAAGQAAPSQPPPVGPIKKQGRQPSGKFAAYQPNEKDRALVLLSSAIGGTQDKIAKVIGVSEDTLRKYYPSEFEDGREFAKISLMGNLYRIATSRTNDMAAIQAITRWMNNYGGWVHPGKAVEAEAQVGPVVVKLKLGERDDA